MVRLWCLVLMTKGLYRGIGRVGEWNYHSINVTATMYSKQRPFHTQMTQYCYMCSRWTCTYLWLDWKYKFCKNDILIFLWVNEIILLCKLIFGSLPYFYSKQAYFIVQIRYYQKNLLRILGVELLFIFQVNGYRWSNMK